MDNITPDILSFIREGDEKAFEILFKAYYARLCAYAYTLINDKEAAAEIVQDFFVKLWENRAGLNIKSPKAYLFKAIHNNSIKYISKRNNFESILSTQEYGFTAPVDFEMADKLDKSLNELPPKCKEIFLMSRLDKLRHNEIAEKLGISPRTVEVQIRKASIILKQKMKEFYTFLCFLL
jgi:RNA polymerase sigma-70 factor, ECF subfamily